MTIKKICSLIERELKHAPEEVLLGIVYKYLPEESIGSIGDDTDFREEVIQIIVEEAESDEDIMMELYENIFDEKISIETENENYYDEEFE